MENILVTGGAGYIGSHIVEQLLKTNKRVIIVDNLSTGHKKLINKKAKFFLCDIKNFKKLNKIFAKNKVSSVIHLAASLSVGESQKKPKKYFSNNVLGTKNIIRCCKQNNINNLIFSSTCAVYKDKLRLVNENSIINPKSVYGKTKLKAEKYIKKNFKNKKTNFAILRYFNVAGASETGKIGQISRGDQLFKNLSIASMQIQPKINIYGGDYKTKDGTCIRDYIHVSDIAKIHLLVLKKINREKKSIILNCGYGKGISVYEAINEFQKQSRKRFSVKIKNRRKGDMEEIIADNSKIQNFIKWKPKKNSLSYIVKSCIKWEKKIK
jgi:UDP-glucose 4-epimerase